jgi:outer membrane lipoprotein-sorting protein
MEAKVPDVDYPKKKIWVRKDNYLPLKEQSFSSSGTLMSTRYSLSYQRVDGHYIPIKQIMVDEFEKGNKTLVEIKNIVFSPIPETVFTKAYLENLSK